MSRRMFILSIVIILCIAVANAVPLLWGMLTSIKSPTEIIAFPPDVFPSQPTGEHYARVLDGGYARPLLNSLLYAAAATIVAAVVGMAAAYAFDRYRFPFRKLLFMLVVASIPLSMGAAALLVPNYILFKTIGITDRFYTLPLIYTAYALPMAIWILKGGLEGIPTEIDEAARIDGAGIWRTLTKVLVPLSLPGLGAAAIFVFITSWNEFVTSSVLVSGTELRPVQPAIYQFIGFFGREWGPLTAAAVMAIIPILILFGLLGRTMVSGLTAGAVKG